MPSDRVAPVSAAVPPGPLFGAITADHVADALDDLGVRAPRLRFVGDLWGGQHGFGGTGFFTCEVAPGQTSLIACSTSPRPRSIGGAVRLSSGGRDSCAG